VIDLTYGRRLTAAETKALRVALSHATTGGVIIVARSDKDAVRIRRELLRLRVPLSRHRSTLAFPGDRFATNCL
jgi:hypothetical protein